MSEDFGWHGLVIVKTIIFCFQFKELFLFQVKCTIISNMNCRFLKFDFVSFTNLFGTFFVFIVAAQKIHMAREELWHFFFFWHSRSERFVIPLVEILNPALTCDE